MSIIDKIAIGINNKRSGNNLHFDCSTTANIGVIQPTMCKEMVPKETLHVSVKSLCRLLSLQNPTFGRMSLRHYHTFVPYNRLWRPFDAMIANKPYNAVSDLEQSLHYFATTPYFGGDTISTLIKRYSDVSIYYGADWNNAVAPGNTVNGVSFSSDPATFVQQVLGISTDNPLEAYMHYAFCPFNTDANDTYFNDESLSSRIPSRGFGYNDLGVFNCGQFALSPELNGYWTVSDNLDLLTYPSQNVVITEENADLVIQTNTWTFMLKFKPILKKIRQIFIGLGYGFNPWYSESVRFSPFKLYAYYASVFELFYPKREKNFQQTNCYMLTQLANYFTLSVAPISGNFDNASDAARASICWVNFIFDELPRLTYYLPMDYFSASTPTIELEQNGTNISTFVSGSSSNPTQQTIAQQQNGSIPNVNVTNPLILRLANTLFRFSNKNTVLGRNVRDYLHAHYGITDVAEDVSSPVYRIGSSRVNLDITPVLSTADTSDGDKGSALGSFAGQGVGYKESETFDYTAHTFGVWITLTVVVPESGFYQGYLRENRHLNRNDFFAEAYDALGYQVTERGEVSSDYTAHGPMFNPSSSVEYTKGFGFMPRYSEYKTSQNIVNGDLSLRGLRNSMASFHLDRKFPTENLKKHTRYNSTTGETEILTNVDSPAYVPTTVFDGFRAIDQTDIVGDYNRIFTYMGNDYDHFIIQNVFKVRAVAPWKPLSSSFDTFDDEDNSSIKVQKA